MSEFPDTIPTRFILFDGTTEILDTRDEPVEQIAFEALQKFLDRDTPMPPRERWIPRPDQKIGYSEWAPLRAPDDEPDVPRCTLDLPIVTSLQLSAAVRENRTSRNVIMNAALLEYFLPDLSADS